MSSSTESAARSFLWMNPGAQYSLLHQQFSRDEVEFLFTWFEESDKVKIERFRNGANAGDEDFCKAEARKTYQELLNAGFKVKASSKATENAVH